MTQVIPKWFKQTEIGVIPEEWEIKILNDLWKIITWNTPASKNPEYFWDKIMFITPTDFSNYWKYSNKSNRYISDKWINNNKTRILTKNSVVVTCIGSDMGKVVITREEALTNQQINSISNIELYSVDYIYYYIKKIYWYLRLLSTWWSTMPIINKTDFSKILFVSPPLPQQKAIAEILSSLDDKIELLEKQNKTLENIGQAIFKSWFVDFEGFENDLVESEMGMIPRGWKVGKLGEVIKNYDSKRIPLSSMERSKRPGVFPYYWATSIMSYVNDYIFDWTYVFMWEDWSVIKDNWKPFTQYVWWKIWVNNHAHVLQWVNWFSTELIKLFLDSTDIAPYITWAVQPKINQWNMNSIPVLIPGYIELDKINNLIIPLFKKIKENIGQIKTNTNIRNSLLPRLMNGKVRV